MAVGPWTGQAKEKTTMKTGSLHLILGPMFSGKTSEMRRRIQREQVAHRCCVVIKYAGDTRYSSGRTLLTHSRDSIDAIPASLLLSLTEADLDGVDAIGIDEGQFFPDLVDFCLEQVDTYGRTVIVAALDGNFHQKPIGRTLELVPKAESIVKLTAVCMDCRKADAPFTVRLTDQEDEIVVGGAETYMAVCRACLEGPQDD